MNQSRAIDRYSSSPLSLTRSIVLFALFYLSWYLCVSAGAWGQPLLAVLAAPVLLLFLYFAPGPAASLRYTACVSLFGAFADRAAEGAGVIRFTTGTPIFGLLAPIWLLAVWWIFAASIPHFFSWLRDRPLLAAALGACCAPVSYFAGVKLGAISLPQGEWVFGLVVAAEWGLGLPLMIDLGERMEIFHRASEPALRPVKTEDHNTTSPDHSST